MLTESREYVILYVERPLAPPLHISACTLPGMSDSFIVPGAFITAFLPNKVSTFVTCLGPGIEISCLRSTVGRVSPKTTIEIITPLRSVICNKQSNDVE